MEKNPIDVVVTWVDGDDPVHRAKRLEYESAEQLADSEIGGEIRYKSIGEINYCIASLLKFAPFIRKIFIVTDGQDPHLDEFLDKYFPQRTTEIEIVDHSVIYRGHEDYLPIFASRSLETVLWRIPGLSEQYVFLNDDFLLIRPVSPEDFFQDGKAVCYGHRSSIMIANLKRALRRKSIKAAKFRDMLVNAALTAGQKRHFIYLGHTPHAVKVSTQEKFYSEHPKVMEMNMSQRFREPFQFNPQSLFYSLADAEGECIFRSRKKYGVYMKPKKRERYMRRKLADFDRSKALFCCFNSLAEATENDIRLAEEWMKNRLGLDK